MGTRPTLAKGRSAGIRTYVAFGHQRTTNSGLLCTRHHEQIDRMSDQQAIPHGLLRLSIQAHKGFGSPNQFAFLDATFRYGPANAQGNPKCFASI